MKHSLKTTLFCGLVAALVLSTAAAPSTAYFTTYVTAAGAVPVHLKTVIPEMEEKYEDGVKTVTLKNTGEAPCYVRVRAFWGADELNVTPGPGPDWALDATDGCCYYQKILQPEETTAAITFTIDLEHAPAHDFNVVVVAEGAPILYNADGTVDANSSRYAGWTMEYKYLAHQEGTYGKDGATTPAAP